MSIKKALLVTMSVVSVGFLSNAMFATTISGSTTSPSTLPTGSGDVTTGQVVLTINAANTPDTNDAATAASGSFEIQSFACLNNKGEFDPNCRGSDKTLFPIGQEIGEVQCIKADGTGNVWFSGAYTSIPQADGRSPGEYNAMIDTLVNSDATQSHWIFFGRLSDTNSDGIADMRSFIFEQADLAQANPITSNGFVWSTAYLDQQGALVGGTLTGANACEAGDALMISADYRVVNRDSVQWLNTSGHPFEKAVENTAFNLANPPDGTVYSLSAPTRSLINTDQYTGINIAN